MTTHYHGENAITFSLINDLDKPKLAELLNLATWSQTMQLTPSQICYAHLFPCFGKRSGYGEPDAIIITDNFVIYIEVELLDPSKRKMPRGFYKQLNNFILLARSIWESPRKRLINKNKFKGLGGKSFYGGRPLRRVFRQIKEKDRKPAFLVMSNGAARQTTKSAVLAMASRFGLNDEPLGWLDFGTIKKEVNGIDETVNIIEDVLWQ